MCLMFEFNKESCFFESPLRSFSLLVPNSLLFARSYEVKILVVPRDRHERSVLSE